MRGARLVPILAGSLLVALAAAEPVSAGTPPAGTHVLVGDDFYDPSTVVVDAGETVIFDNGGIQHHTTTDDSGMDLYDSSVVAPGDSSWFTFTAAGGYPFTCTLHPWMGGSVRVPVQVTPSAGGLAKRYLITWATNPAPAGFVYDVQIRRPGADWRRWQRGTERRSARHRPRAGPGRYRFRARLRQLGTGETSDWSPARSFVAS